MSTLLNFRKRHDGPKTAESHKNWMGGPSHTITNPLLRLKLAASSCFFGEPMYYHRDEKDKRAKKSGAFIGDNRRLIFRPSSDQPEPPDSGKVMRVFTPAESKHLRDTMGASIPEQWEGLSPSELMEKAIDEALEYDAQKTLELAVELRTEGNIRLTPQIILVRAANHLAVKGTPLVRRYARKIVSRADEPASCMAYQLQKWGKPIPNSLKRALSDAYGRFDEYKVAKYRLEGRLVSSRDVANLVHPEGNRESPIYRLRGGDLRIGQRRHAGGRETWESMISREGASQRTWRKAVPVMGHMALLRNLRNLLQHNVAPAEFVDKLVEGSAKGRQLPFRYLTAYQAVSDVGATKIVKDALEACLSESMGNLPPFEGRVMSLCDNSTSAQHQTLSPMSGMTFADIGNMMGIITGIVADEGYLGVFGDRLEIQEVRRDVSVFPQTQAATMAGTRIGGDTEHGVWIFWSEAIKHKAVYDHVFIYSDMQAGHGGLYGLDGSLYKDFIWPIEKGHAGNRYIDVPSLIERYRQEVNPDVNVYMVQIAGYQDTLMPEFYHRSYILGGWSESILRFASEMNNIMQHVQVAA